MTLRGAPYTPAKPRCARGRGVAMVFQHFSLFEALSVAENIALGMETPPPLSQLATRIREVSEAYGLPLDPARRWAIFRRANASGSRSSAACCRTRAPDHG
jgi:ABC-type uncharacterized transport system ATPase subunit